MGKHSGRFLVYSASDTNTTLSISSLTLSGNTTYFYRGFALNSQGLSMSFSADISTATRANDPSQPASTFTFVGPSDISVQWGSNSNPADTTYLVFVSTTLNFNAPPITTTTVQTVNMTSSSLNEATTYYFRVRALNYQGLPSNFTAIGSTRTSVSTDFTAPAAISGLTALTGVIDGQVELRWSSVGDDDLVGVLNGAQYRIRYSTTPVGFFSSSFTDLSGGGATLSVGDIFVGTSGVAPGINVGRVMDGLNPGTTYFFAVIAKDDSGNWGIFNRTPVINRISFRRGL